ncbi:MAG: ATP-binding cassette domain-containing protein, partial [Pseudomonadota bacterium]
MSVAEDTAFASAAAPAAAEEAAAIEARGLDLVFETRDGPVHALSGVDLTIRPGDFVSFIGPSGCGKTTFLRVVAA